jgi:hypothetical protein
VTVWVEDPAGLAVMGARVRLDVESTGSLAHDPAALHINYGLGTSLPTGGTHVLFLGVPAGSVGVKVTLPTGSCTTWPGTRLVDRVPVEAGGHHGPHGVRALTHAAVSWGGEAALGRRATTPCSEAVSRSRRTHRGATA